MSVLFARLLREAENHLDAGAAADAETTCCQVLTGAVTLKNADLIEQSIALLRRIPKVDPTQRYAAIWQLSNLIQKMQDGQDRGLALRLCDVLISATEDMPYEQHNALNLALFISGSRLTKQRDPSFAHYLDRLIACEAHQAEAGADDLPLELTADVDPALATRTLAGRGTVLIRQLFEPTQLAGWRDAAQSYLSAHNVQAGSITNLGDTKTLLGDPAAAFIARVLTPFFPYEFELLESNSFFRRVGPRNPEATVPFHQDVNAFGRLMINVWTPLVACGRDAPGLEVVARRTATQFATSPTGSRSQYDDLQIAESTVLEQFGEDALFHPDMSPGDALILLGTTIHRTYMIPAMTEQRLSLELRFTLT